MEIGHDYIQLLLYNVTDCLIENAHVICINCTDKSVPCLSMQDTGVSLYCSCNEYNIVLNVSVI